VEKPFSESEVTIALLIMHVFALKITINTLIIFSYLIRNK